MSKYCSCLRFDRHSEVHSFLLNYDRILISISLLDRYDVSQEILKNRKRKETLRSIELIVTEISETFLSKAHQTQLNIEKGSLSCLLATLTSLYIKQLKRLNYFVFDLAFSQPTGALVYLLSIIIFKSFNILNTFNCN